MNINETQINYTDGRFISELILFIIFYLHSRYIDDIFFTSNDPIDQVNKMLNDANNRHSNIKIPSIIDNPTSFLDVKIVNIGSTAITSVYHKEAAEPYVVQFQSDHPRHVVANIIECALLRALRYSSTLLEFNQERRAIKLMLLYNGSVHLVFYSLLINIYPLCLSSSYPTRYIHSQFEKFFTEYSIRSTSIIPMIHDENDFLLVRAQLLNQASIHEHQRAVRIAETMDYNNLPSRYRSISQSKTIETTRANEFDYHSLRVREAFFSMAGQFIRYGTTHFKIRLPKL